MTREQAIKAMAYGERALDALDSARKAREGVRSMKAGAEALREGVAGGLGERWVFGMLTGIMGVIALPSLLKKGG